MSFLIGLIGQDIGASLSPQLYEAEAREHALVLTYRLIETGLGEDLAARLAGARAFGFDGLNITHPFKQAIMAHLDALSPEAEAVGAVNTVVFGRAGAVGHNTDWSGFHESLSLQLPGAALDVVAQVGCGGAGSATAYGLLKSGVAELRLVDAEPDRAEALARRMGALFPGRAVRALSDRRAALTGAQGLVQATPVGMTAHPGLPLDPALVTPGTWVIDIIYFPRETAFLKAVRARGRRALNGLGMVACQGARAFELFTGRPADAARILERLSALG